MQKITDKEYRAAIYLRLSLEDGDISVSDKQESNSISTQRDMIHAFIRKHPEIIFHAEYCDDGYTGTNFDRPGFTKMMDAVKSKEINCIIVKDLSRFGREYIESGKYIQKIFPMMGVRFIAINDAYDSVDQNSQINDFVLPFKNLMNDSYCRDISIKSRTSLEVKRRNGEFVNSFAVYGYMRDPENKHKLIVDEEAAKVVRNIYNWKLEGWTALQIAKHLNEHNIPSPMEYKKRCGHGYQTGFKTKTTTEWSAVAIFRILRNVVYTGVLEQGKSTTPNYKVNVRRMKDESEWARIENAHDAIISSAQFKLVQEVLSMDTCRASADDDVYPFSGMIFCADCGSAMIHRTATTGGKKYEYYICSGNKQDKHSCTPHSIRCSLVEQAVLETVKAHISMAIDIESALKQVEALEWEQREVKKITAQIESLEVDIEKYNRLKLDAYEDIKDGLITRDEYNRFRAEYDHRIASAKQKIAKLVGERKAILEGSTEKQNWFAQFRQYSNIQQLTRFVIVNLIERVEIDASKGVYVTFRHKDQFSDALAYLSEYRDKKNNIIAIKEAGWNGKNLPQTENRIAQSSFVGAN